jgi:hypothetical protein
MANSVANPSNMDVEIFTRVDSCDLKCGAKKVKPINLKKVFFPEPGGAHCYRIWLTGIRNRLPLNKPRRATSGGTSFGRLQSERLGKNTGMISTCELRIDCMPKRIEKHGDFFKPVLQNCAGSPLEMLA